VQGNIEKTKITATSHTAFEIQLSYAFELSLADNKEIMTLCQEIPELSLTIV
jgi:hypothetical protein